MSEEAPKKGILHSSHSESDREREREKMQHLLWPNANESMVMKMPLNHLILINSASTMGKMIDGRGRKPGPGNEG